MSSQTTNNGWRRVLTGVVAGGALAVGLVIGSSTTAHADVLDDIGVKYMQGAGGGQISNFVKESLILRSQVFKPSKSNLEALQAGWDYLPNQVRLVDALKETVAYQRRMQAITQNARTSQGPLTTGIGQLPPGQNPNPAEPNNPGVSVGGPNGGGINIPIG